MIVPVFTLNGLKASENNTTYMPHMYVDLLPYLTASEFAVLSIGARHYPRPMPSNEIAYRCNLRAITAHRAISSLVKIGLIVQVEGGYVNQPNVSIDTDNLKHKP
jgi:predicted transcriptional regulator